MNAYFLLSLISTISISINMDTIAPNIQIDAKGGAQILLRNEVLASEPGYPSLPSIPIFVAMHNGEKASEIVVKRAEYRKLSGKYFIKPQQPPAILPFPGYNPKIDAVEPDQAVYLSNSWYPQNPIEMDRTGDFGGVPVVGLKLYPFRYNPHDSTVEVLSSLEVEVKTVQGKRWVSPPRTEYSARLWQGILEKFVQNPQDVMVEPSKTDSSFDYLIVTTAGLQNPFESLANWLNERGIKAKVALLDTLIANFSGRDEAERLRNAVRYVYQHYGISYLLLGGDTDVIPDRVAYAMTSGAGYMSDEDSLRADLYFSDLDGSWDANGNNTFGEVADSVDLYPDVFVGRAPVSNAYQALTFVNKVIRYSEPIVTDYQNHELFFAEILWHSPYTDAGEGKDLIDSLYVPDSVTITRLYESLGNESPSSVMNAINQGANLQNHDGHGFYYVMGAGSGYLYGSDMDALTNANRPGVLYSIGCWVGAFDYDAISEHYIKNPHGGGAAFIGNSRYGWGSPGNPGYGYSDKLDTEFYGWVFQRGVTQIGVAMALDKAMFIPYSRQANVFRWHQYQVNLLGDPEMAIWRGSPSELVVRSESEVSDGGVLHITTEPPIDGRGAISADGALITSFPIANGVGEAHLPNGLNADSVKLKVVADGYLPCERYISVLHSGPFLSITSFSVLDTGSAFPDSIPTPLDRGTISFHIRNIGTEPSPETAFTVTSLNDSVNLSGTTTLPAIQPDDSVSVQFPFSIGMIPFERARIAAIFGDDTTIIGFNVKSPLLKVIDFVPDSFIVVGDNHVSVELANTGNATAHHGVIVLHPVEPCMVIQPDTLELDELQSGDTAWFDIEITVPQAANGESFPIEALMDVDGMAQSDTVIVIVGVRPYESSFEDENGLNGWEPHGEWHLTSYRTHSGDSAWYCGVEQQRRYYNNADYYLVSPPFIAGDAPSLSFYMFFRVTTYGSDGIYVYVERDGQRQLIDYIGSGGALDSLLGFWTDWAVYSYSLENYLSAGDTFRVSFRFKSDDEDTDEGFYIDDFSMTDVVPLINNSVSENTAASGNKISVSMFSGGFNLSVRGEPYSTAELAIYDAAGRVVKAMELHFNGIGEATAHVEHLPSGVYVVKTGNEMVKAVVTK